MIERRYGEVPQGDVVFAACDANYFMKFAPAFVESVVKNTHYNVHIHVINPDQKVFALASYLTTRGKVTYTFQDTDVSPFGDEPKRALYASLRFFVAPFILSQVERLLILDIDCLVMEDFEFPKKPVGYFPREPLEGTVGWEQEGTKCAAGCVYFHKDALNVVNAICETLEGMPLRWFNDQIALNHVMSQVPEEHIHKFDGNFMDWEFKDGTTIWTGKGPRKYENVRYVEMQNKYNDYAMNYDLEDYVQKVILAPRLDIPFKQFDVVRAGSVNEPIREHWKRFIDLKCSEGYTIVEAPRWMFNHHIEEYFPNAEFLVPHVERHNWGGGDKTQFYMQTVFPWLFTIDSEGWAGGAKYIETFNPEAEFNEDAFYMMKEQLGEGKFGHLQSDNTPWDKINDEYIVVPLQLPHDETIQWHYDYSVATWVEELCKMAVEHPEMPQLVFKGHPVNLASMEPLKEIIERYGQLYISDANFNELVKRATAMFVLNGGSGQEAMLHEIPVVCFGKCDYAPAVINGETFNPYEAWEAVEDANWVEMLDMYKRWYDWYINQICINTRG